uniref:Uncharacterized protein n=2 Tax=Gasterosteus aculeatus aculeatus TaxID=481459 RepID=A0AAQ4RH76_GASAC
MWLKRRRSPSLLRPRRMRLEERMTRRGSGQRARCRPTGEPGHACSKPRNLSARTGGMADHLMMPMNHSSAGASLHGYRMGMNGGLQAGHQPHANQQGMRALPNGQMMHYGGAQANMETAMRQRQGMVGGPMNGQLNGAQMGHHQMTSGNMMYNGQQQQQQHHPQQQHHMHPQQQQQHHHQQQQQQQQHQQHQQQPSTHSSSTTQQFMNGGLRSSSSWSACSCKNSTPSTMDTYWYLWVVTTWGP